MKNKILMQLLALAFIAFACNEQPTQMGSSLISDTLELVPLTSKTNQIIVENKSIKRRAPGFISGSMFIGTFSNTTAFSFLRFGNLPDSLNYLTVADISSAELVLFPDRYALGDTVSGAQSFTVYDLKKPFFATTNYDTVEAQGGLISWINKEAGSFNGSIPLKETMDPISISINKDVVIDWLKFAATGDTNSYSYSMALAPNQNSRVINRFKTADIGSLNNSPQLNIKFKNKAGVEDSLNLKAFITNYYANAPQPGPDEMVVQGGIVYRTELHFDLSMIPKFSSIHKAQLEVYLDRSKSIFSNFGVDSILTVIYPINPGAADSLSPYQARLEGENKYVFPSISSAIENIVSNGGKGFITFQAARSGATANEYRYLDRHVLFGINALENLRPVLKIIYSKRPQLKPE